MAVHFKIRLKNFGKYQIKELQRLDLRRGGTYTTLCRIFIGRELPLCGPLRISAFSALKSYFNAEAAEIRRGAQRNFQFGCQQFLATQICSSCIRGFVFQVLFVF